MNEKKIGDLINTILFSSLIVSLIMTILLPFISFSNQIYPDFIYGISLYNTNKSLELAVYKSLLLVGSIVSLLFGIKINHTPHKDNPPKLPYIYYFLIGLVLTTVIFSTVISTKLITALFFYIVVYSLWQNYANKLMLMGFFSYYTTTAIIALITFLVPICPAYEIFYKFGDDVNQIFLLILSMILTLGIICLWKKFGEKFLNKTILILQIFLPLNLLIYFKETYEYGEKVIKLPYPALFYIVISFVILFAFYNAFCFIKKQFLEKNLNIKTLISLSSVLVIFAMNSFTSPAQIIPSDLFHHGEQIVEFQQVFGQNLTLYKDFTPSSGNYSLLTGTVLKLMGDNATIYPVAYSLILFCFAILVGVLSYTLAGSPISLLLGASTGLFIYNRGYLILPILLILTLPKLINNRDLWLKIWILLIIIGGFYYPIYGASMFFATLPFGFVQFKEFLKTNYQKNFKFYFSWIVMFLVVAVMLPIFLNMAKHILLLANQSMLADGATILNPRQFMPKEYLTFLPTGIRFVFYILSKIFIPTISVILPFTVLGTIWINNKNNVFYKSPLFLVLSSSIIFQIVAFSYTLIAADESTIISRTAIVVVPILQYLTLGLYIFGKDYLKESTKKQLVILTLILASGIMFSTIFSNWFSCDIKHKIGGLQNDSCKLSASFKYLNNDYIFVDGKKLNIKKLGKGFMKCENFEKLKEYNNFIQTHKMQNATFMNLPRMFYYILDVKSCYNDLTYLFQTKKAQDNYIKYLNKVSEKPIIADFEHLGNYEILKWIEDNNYIKLKNGWFVYVNDLEKYHLNNNDIEKNYNLFDDEINFDISCNSFGKSIKTLEKAFDRTLSMPVDDVIYDKNSLKINFKDKINGKEFDYLYLKININEDLNKKFFGSFDNRLLTLYKNNQELSKYTLNIYWDNKKNQPIVTVLGNGELLIPLGYNSSWRNNFHKNLLIEIKNMPNLKIEKIEFFGR